MRLDYQRAPNVVQACPDEEAFRHMVGVFNKGEDAFSPDAADVLRVTLDQRGAAYHTTIAVIAPDGTQRGAAEEHTLRTCPEAAREAASTAYLVVAPFTFPTPPPPPPRPSRRPPPTPPRPAPSPPRASCLRAARRGWGPRGRLLAEPVRGLRGVVGVRFARLAVLVVCRPRDARTSTRAAT